MSTIAKSLVASVALAATLGAVSAAYAKGGGGHGGGGGGHAFGGGGHAFGGGGHAVGGGGHAFGGGGHAVGGGGHAFGGGGRVGGSSRGIAGNKPRVPGGSRGITGNKPRVPGGSRGIAGNKPRVPGGNRGVVGNKPRIPGRIVNKPHVPGGIVNRPHVRGGGRFVVHKIWRVGIGGGWYWYDPDASAWIARDGEAVPEDPYFATASIRIRNPDSTNTELNYSLNNTDNFTIQPGEKQYLPSDQSWVIQFDRGGDFGNAQYVLDSGEYFFGESDHGWELYHLDTATDDT